MKKILCYCLWLVLALVGCRTTYQAINPTYLLGDASQMKVRCVGFGRNDQEATEQAQRAVLSALLFRGYPGSQQETPLAGIAEAEVQGSNKAYFDEFWGKERYKTFITSTIPVSDLIRYEKGTKQLTVEVTVNLRALRSDLEHHGVIRKFGF